MRTTNGYSIRSTKELEDIRRQIERELDHLVDSGRKGLHDYTALARALEGLQQELRRRNDEERARSAARQPDLPGFTFAPS